MLANFNGKEHLRHRAVSLRQHGFLVIHEHNIADVMGVIEVLLCPYRCLEYIMVTHSLVDHRR